jgi:hypothetical protein
MQSIKPGVTIESWTTQNVQMLLVVDVVTEKRETVLARDTVISSKTSLIVYTGKHDVG